MENWFWPQYVTALWISARAIEKAVELIRNKELSSTQVMIAIFVMITIQVGVIGVLRAGGFW